MSNVADAGQNAASSRASEPVPEDGHTAERTCLNCSTPLVGSHCHGCGQAAHVHRTLTAFFHDLLHGVFHFEGKIWRTLPLLAWRPGRLTREYIEGRRASYVSPIALFLFVVFLTFALFSLLGGGVGEGIRVDTRQSVSVARASLDQELADLRAKRAQAVAAGGDTSAVDEEIASNRRNRAALEAFAAPESSLKVSVAGGRGGDAVARSLTNAWRRVKENPSLAIYKLQSNAYKFSWLLIPLSVPFLWLLFPFSRRFQVYDHTVFVTYSISAMLLLLALFSISIAYDLGPLAVVPFLYAPFHMYRQLKEGYDLTRSGALWRTAAMMLFASVALLLFAGALIALAMND